MKMPKKFKLPPSQIEPIKFPQAPWFMAFRPNQIDPGFQVVELSPSRQNLNGCPVSGVVVTSQAIYGKLRHDILLGHYITEDRGDIQIEPNGLLGVSGELFQAIFWFTLIAKFIP